MLSYLPHLQSLRLSQVLSSKRGRVALIACLVFLACVALYGFDTTSWPLLSSKVSAPTLHGLADQTSDDLTGRFHLLIPATSSNSELCKLLLSAQLLNYPTPVLINFGETEDQDPYVQHLNKIEGFLDYLNDLNTTRTYDKDIVLIVDGYDALFQLPRDVLLERYFAINEAADRRTLQIYGDELVKQHDIRQTIVFGPDKICWPNGRNGYSRPACWAVPETTLSTTAFGPQTGKGREDQNQPRWLNSGTMIGPVDHVKELLNATLNDIRASEKVVASDQYYLAEVFGRQEYARLQLKPELMEHYKSIKYKGEETLSADKLIRSRPDAAAAARTEYHVGIDYESSMFQIVSFWKQYLAWMRPVDSWPDLATSDTDNPFQFRLPDDLQRFPPPLSNTNASRPNGLEDGPRSWQDVELLYNTATQQVPVTLHFTGEKKFREPWWRKLWFQSQAGTLRRSSLAALSGSGKSALIAGHRWVNAEPEDTDEIEFRGKGGAWADRYRGWYNWKGLCGEFEDGLYNVTDGGFFHATTNKSPPADHASGHAHHSWPHSGARSP